MRQVDACKQGRPNSANCQLWCVLAWQAREAINSLRGSVDTLIVIPNDKLLDGARNPGRYS